MAADVEVLAGLSELLAQTRFQGSEERAKLLVDRNP
jgi:hypothetical protein